MGNSLFTGWSGDCSGTGACTMTLTQNTSVMASFSGSPVLTVALGGTGKGSVASNPSGINCGTTCNASFNPGTQVTLTEIPETNSNFVGWGGACSGHHSTCTLTLSASQQVTATFNTTQSTSVLTVSLAGTGTGTVSSSPAGINCPQTCSASFKAGTQVTLTETPGTNSNFAGWGGACSGTNPTCALTLNVSQSVTASFSPGPPVLTVSLPGTGTGTVTSSPSGIDCPPQTCSASFKAGTQVTLTETPGTNSYFAGWGGACSGTDPACALTLNASQQVTATFNPLPVLTVSLEGTGTGNVTSNPSGINCGTTCNASFNPGTQVTLTEIPGTNSNFVGWGGACSGGRSTCTLTLNENQQVTATFNPQNITALNHIILLAQENRSFDHYFGELREYWVQNGYPDQSFDGLPQFNPTSGPPPLYGPPPAIPGCDPNAPPPSDCVFDPNNPITSYHLITQCTENTNPGWDESHFDWDYYDPVGNLPAASNGFVWSAGHFARTLPHPFYDVDGIRAIGYYDGGDLNYYYFMASNFATSDRWFNPEMARTAPNRTYLIGATSQGYVFPVGSDSKDKALLTATPIFEELENANVSWKIYVNPTNSKCLGPPYDAACLLTLSYVQFFKWGTTIPSLYPHNIGTIGIVDSDFDNDLKNETLPQAALIEPASDAGFDEHESDFDKVPSDIQKGAKYASSIINSLMASTSWKDSAFILTYDEFGGLYDHVPPQQTVNPDGIKPVDLLPTNVCAKTTGPLCDFVYTGYRVPLIVVSPYTRQNYVSHTPADTTAILKLIETRFNLPPLTKRDAAQMDMTEFFDFSNPVWLTPPTPPTQNTNGACYMNKLP